MTLEGIASFHIRDFPGVYSWLPSSESLVVSDGSSLLRKEVIQPLVPQRLPCYDFIPVTNHTLGASLRCRSGQRLRVQSAPMM